MKFTTEGFDAQIRRAEERGREESSSEIAALQEAVHIASSDRYYDDMDAWRASPEVVRALEEK